MNNTMELSERLSAPSKNFIDELFPLMKTEKPPTTETSIMSNKPFVYVAGAYTNPDPIQNTHDALKMGTELEEDGVVTPFIPHVTLLWHMVTPRPYQFWLDYDIEVLHKCDALFRFTDLESSGADKEEKVAREMGIPVFYTKEDLYSWCEDKGGSYAWL